MQLSVKPREKKNILQILPKFFLLLKKNAIWKNIICKARLNLMIPIQKGSRSTCFLCLPHKAPAKLS
jgi:hypothetical protein